MPRHDYALIVGQGRSGTNWLLQLFDLSAETFCRNEPYGNPESPLNRLTHHRWVVQPDQRELEERWDAAIRWTSVMMGERDPRIRVRKSFMYEVSRLLGWYRAIHGPRSRRVLAAVMPSLRSGEWPIPWWLGSRASLERAMPVLKLVTSPGWATFVLRHRPEVQVCHIVRHPGGFLNSWARRYLAQADTLGVQRANRARLREVVAADPEWCDVFGDIDAMPADESELWYWRYANETVFRAGRGAANYHHVFYEDLVRDPVAATKPLYEATGLTWGASIERSVRNTTRSSNVADSWRETLSPAQLDLVERFADGAHGFYEPVEHTPSSS